MRDKDSFLSRAFSGAIGTLGEAWTELRTHKLRVILSLIGIAVAVAALTAVVALGELQKQASLENQERWGGRIATIRIDTYSSTGTVIDWGKVDEHFNSVNERYGFTHSSRVVDRAIQLDLQLPEGVTKVSSRLYDPTYPTIHRLKLKEGRWFVTEDSGFLAPSVIISEALWERLGSPALDTLPALQLKNDLNGTYPIIGVTPKDGEWDQELLVDMLFDSYLERVEKLPDEAQVIREIWLKDENANEIGPVLAMDLRAGMPKDVEISLNRTDVGASADFESSFLIMQLITGAISGIVLLLGGLSLVNIQLVAMRQRIREIGIRRSFGATGARIFNSVMMESVVATTVAGMFGIMLAVVLLRSPIVIQNMFYGMQDTPPFPFYAAILGLAAAVVTGAISGLVPAIVATRVRVIDAIRY